MPKDKCKRCGQCCYLVLRNEFGEPYPTAMPCPYLTEDNLCRVYKNRLKSKVGEGFQCSPREESHFDYEGCPYNTGKPLVINHKL